VTAPKKPERIPGQDVLLKKAQAEQEAREKEKQKREQSERQEEDDARES
jgi:hypothetical protein